MAGILGLVLGGADTAARSGDWSCAFQRREWVRADDDAGDRAALVAFAKATELSQWYSGSRNWLNESVSVCEWEGICCQPPTSTGGTDHDAAKVSSSSSSRVTEIHVERNGLRGAFPDEFASTLSKLQVLNVHLNWLTNFPPKVEELIELREAKFGRNPICGTVPKGFGSLTKLTKFNCNFCCLSGEFPDLFANMPGLQEAFWNGNNFTGSIPPSVTRLHDLAKLSFNLNSLSGPVPAGLAGLPQIDDCRIGSDTAFGPYDTSPGSPERAWLLKWRGNDFDCPVPPSVLNSSCNNGHANPTASPINCTGRWTSRRPLVLGTI